MLGFKDAVLVPVCSWRPRMNSFTALPSHCSVIVPLEGKWIVIDVCTVDCIDGVLDLSVKLNTEQVVNNGVKYKFVIFPDSHYNFTGEIREKLLKVDPEFADSKNYVTVGLIKEEPKRDDDYNIVEPMVMEWLPRFSFNLPRKNGSTEKKDDSAVEYIREIVSLPHSLDHKIGTILMDHTTYSDPRAHHAKQWIGIRYSVDGQSKYLVSGYRFIEVKRPHSNRKLTWCGGQCPTPIKSDQVPSDLPVPQNATDEALKHLLHDIGIKRTDDEIQNLKTAHNYYNTNIEHVWAI